MNNLQKISDLVNSIQRLTTRKCHLTDELEHLEEEGSAYYTNKELVYTYNMFGHDLSLGDLQYAIDSFKYELQGEHTISELLVPRKRIIGDVEYCTIEMDKTLEPDPYEDYDTEVTDINFYAEVGLTEESVEEERLKLEKELKEVRLSIETKEKELKELVRDE